MTTSERTTIAKTLKEYRRVLREHNLKPLKMRIVIKKGEFVLKWPRDKLVGKMTLDEYFRRGRNRTQKAEAGPEPCGHVSLEHG
jgi:hypothetical protein